MNKPREFALLYFMDDIGLKTLGAFELKKPIDFSCEAHVIEYSAYVRLQSELAELKFELEAKQRPLSGQVLSLTIERDQLLMLARELRDALKASCDSHGSTRTDDDLFTEASEVLGEP